METYKESLLQADPPFLSLAEAFSIDMSGDYKPFALVESGCRLPTGGWNCTAACLDVALGTELLWGQQDTTVSTLFNCLRLPIIANGLANDTVSDPLGLAAKFSIVPSKNMDATFTEEAYPVVANCLNAYCKLSEGNCSGLPFGIAEGPSMCRESWSFCNHTLGPRPVGNLLRR